MTKQVKKVQATSKDAKKKVNTKPAELRCPISKKEAEGLAWAVRDEFAKTDLSLTVSFLQERGIPLGDAIKWLVEAGGDCDINVVHDVEFEHYEWIESGDPSSRTRVDDWVRQPWDPLSAAEMYDLCLYLYEEFDKSGISKTKEFLRKHGLPVKETLKWLAANDVDSDLWVVLLLPCTLDEIFDGDRDEVSGESVTATTAESNDTFGELNTCVKAIRDSERC